MNLYLKRNLPPSTHWKKESHFSYNIIDVQYVNPKSPLCTEQHVFKGNQSIISITYLTLLNCISTTYVFYLLVKTTFSRDTFIWTFYMFCGCFIL